MALLISPLFFITLSASAYIPSLDALVDKMVQQKFIPPPYKGTNELSFMDQKCVENLTIIDHQHARSDLQCGDLKFRFISDSQKKRVLYDDGAMEWTRDTTPLNELFLNRSRATVEQSLLLWKVAAPLESATTTTPSPLTSRITIQRLGNIVATRIDPDAHIVYCLAQPSEVTHYLFIGKKTYRPRLLRRKLTRDDMTYLEEIWIKTYSNIGNQIYPKELEILHDGKSFVKITNRTIQPLSSVSIDFSQLSREQQETSDLAETKPSDALIRFLKDYR